MANDCNNVLTIWHSDPFILREIGLRLQSRRFSADPAEFNSLSFPPEWEARRERHPAGPGSPKMPPVFGCLRYLFWTGWRPPATLLAGLQDEFPGVVLLITWGEEDCQRGWWFQAPGMALNAPEGLTNWNDKDDNPEPDDEVEWDQWWDRKDAWLQEFNKAHAAIFDRCFKLYQEREAPEQPPEPLSVVIAPRGWLPMGTSLIGARVDVGGLPGVVVGIKGDYVLVARDAWEESEAHPPRQVYMAQVALDLTAGPLDHAARLLHGMVYPDDPIPATAPTWEWCANAYESPWWEFSTPSSGGDRWIQFMSEGAEEAKVPAANVPGISGMKCPRRTLNRLLHLHVAHRLKILKPKEA